ncbi:hypothetical protein KO494_13565 [Lacinutrix sp. C3R15]|uniref:hypothetical protein n=1 Tax=Flavobacteriaceae TaxID=49546 RepID=UPI001C0890DC|nr:MULTISPECIES: hypothetical protein [Flavobacteriaceae]MBU2940570.1 hypothetical protein [Lacinutrix sp. C3R15]MDO6623888.1 hypothetical protein [Oceanihabitans sp. 1_MG-2023]
MKKIIVCLLVTLFTVSFCNAQEMTFKKHSFTGYTFYEDGNKIPLNALIEKVSPHAEVLHLVKMSKTKGVFATVISFSGGALIGWPIGAAISGGDPNWVLAGIGAGLAIVAIPVGASAKKDAEKAVGLYNATLHATSFQECKPQYKIIANGNGIGLAMYF